MRTTNHPSVRARAIAALVLSAALCAGLSRAAIPEDTFLDVWAAEINVTLDPALSYDSGSASALENIYETLLTYKGSSLKEFEPLLATAWTASADGRTYTFTLRSGVKFHSGSVMTCADAEYSFRRVLVTNNPNSPAWFFADSLLGTRLNAKENPDMSWAKIAGAVSCDASGKLVFKLVKTDPSFIAKLAFTSGAASVIEKKWAVAGGEWSGTEADWKAWAGKDLSESYLSKNTNGTGAYTLTSLGPDSAVFTRFKDYWGKTPKLERVIWKKVPEESTRVLAMRQGDADRIGLRPALLDQVRGASGVKILEDLPTMDVNYLMMNQSVKNPDNLGSGKLDGQGIPANFFSDLHVRRCFAHAFDTQTFIKEALLGKGKILTMALPEGFLGYDPSIPVLGYDLEQAKRECQLAWGGKVWENGFTVKAFYAGGRVPTTVQFVAAAMQKLNPKFRIEPQQASGTTLYDDEQAGKIPLFISGWFPDYLDPDNYLYGIYHSGGYFAPFMSFKDAQIDALLDRARQTSDPQARAALYGQVGRRAAELVPLVLLPSSPAYEVLSANLKGFEQYRNPMLGGTIRWKDLSK